MLLRLECSDTYYFIFCRALGQGTLMDCTWAVPLEQMGKHIADSAGMAQVMSAGSWGCS